MKTIDYISLNDIFWVQFREHLISFGFKGLPKEMHFTIGFDKRSADINLHITKNVADASNKPKIVIATIQREGFEENFNSLVLGSVAKLLKPLDIAELIKRHNYYLGFLRNNVLLKDLSKAEIIAEEFKKVSRIRRKTQVKIEGDLLQGAESISNNNIFQEMFLNQIDALTEDYFNDLKEGGIIFSEDDSIVAILIDGKWYTNRRNMSLKELAGICLDSQSLNMIIRKINKAIVCLKASNTFEETKELSNPLRLDFYNSTEVPKP